MNKINGQNESMQQAEEPQREGSGGREEISQSTCKRGRHGLCRQILGILQRKNKLIGSQEKMPKANRRYGFPGTSMGAPV